MFSVGASVSFYFEGGHNFTHPRDGGFYGVCVSHNTLRAQINMAAFILATPRGNAMLKLSIKLQLSIFARHVTLEYTFLVI